MGKPKVWLPPYQIQRSIKPYRPTSCSTVDSKHVTQNIVRAALRQFTWVQSAHYSLHTLLEKKKLASDRGKRKPSIDMNHRLMCFNPLLKGILRRCETRLMREIPFHQYDWGRSRRSTTDLYCLHTALPACGWPSGAEMAVTVLTQNTSHGEAVWCLTAHMCLAIISLRHLPGVLCLRSSSTSMNSPAWHSLQCLLLHSGNMLITNELLPHLCPDCVYFLKGCEA